MALRFTEEYRAEVGSSSASEAFASRLVDTDISNSPMNPVLHIQAGRKSASVTVNQPVKQTSVSNLQPHIMISMHLRCCPSFYIIIINYR